MPEPMTTYRSYLVRLWQDDPRAAWRASAHCIQTREIERFAELDGLFVFLAAQTALADPVKRTPMPDDTLNEDEEGE